MKLKCSVACLNGNGEPDLFFVTVECSEEQYNDGKHYEAANSHALDSGYEPMLAYDENDPAGSALAELAIWESMDTIHLV